MKKTTMLDYLREHDEEKIIDYNNPNCINCIECCSIASMVAKEDFNKLKKFLSTTKEGKIAYKEAKARVKKSKLDTNAFSLMCPFLNSKKRCSIYTNRPPVCKEFHCKASLNKLDKSALEKEEYNIIADLFYKK